MRLSKAGTAPKKKNKAGTAPKKKKLSEAGKLVLVYLFACKRDCIDMG